MMASGISWLCLILVCKTCNPGDSLHRSRQYPQVGRPLIICGCMQHLAHLCVQFNQTSTCAALQSSLVKIDLDAGKVVQRWDNIGTKAHAIVAWRDVFLVLDSEAAALVSVNPLNGTVTRLYQVRRGARDSTYLWPVRRLAACLISLHPKPGLA